MTPSTEHPRGMEHDLAQALGLERERVRRLTRQLAHMEELLLVAERAQQLVATHQRRVDERQAALEAAQATIVELGQRIERLERKQPWWRRLRKKLRGGGVGGGGAPRA